MNKLNTEEKQSLEGNLKYVVPYTYIQKKILGQGMPCLVGLGLAFLANICWQHLLDMLQGDNPNWFNYKEFMNNNGFYLGFTTCGDSKRNIEKKIL
jgi:hypothetical protein